MAILTASAGSVGVPPTNAANRCAPHRVAIRPRSVWRGGFRIPPHSPRFAHTAPRDGAVRPRASATSFEPLSDAELGLPECELDAQGRERVTLQAEGWRRWEWRGHACNYIAAGEANTGPIVVLVHGFGAHSYHWRYTIPALARKGFRVYALCMLGYGWSPKVEAEFSMELWGQQVMDFAAEVAGASISDRAVIAGNSIGALAALYAASEGNDRFRGLCLVNSAGNFQPDAAPGPERKTLAQQAVAGSRREDESVDPTLRERLAEAFGRFSAGAIFYFTKVRIKQILQQVYEFEVDQELVKSIDMAAEDEGALGAFYQISLAGGRTRSRPAEQLQAFRGSVMLLWGERDPWMTPTKAELIMALRPDALYVPVLAGHCPQDDAPQESSEAIAKWAASLPP
eukprot:jgi/Tetstr1/465783/TSEL_010405.t1